MGKCKIKLVTHPYALDLYRSRKDYAVITNQGLIERPYWFEQVETGQLYYDIYGIVGYPGEVTDSTNGMPGYAAIVGVARPNSKLGNNNPTNADFQLLAEAESRDVPQLLDHCLRLREDYGFGIQRDLLTSWLGDPDRFLTTLALKNEVLIGEGGEVSAILLAPPNDFYVPKIFDMYVRALRSTLLKDTRRFYFGHNEILKNRLREFKRDDPCVMAVGGLVHSLLCRCTWMDAQQGTAFTVEDDSDG